MAEKIEDLNLPHSVVQKIIKDALPDNVNIGKDVKNAMAKAAAMFILYITSHGIQFAQKVNRKTVIAQDIFDALEETEFGELIEPLKEALNGIINSLCSYNIYVTWYVSEFKNGKQKKDEADSKNEDTAEEEEIEESASAESEDNESW